MAIANPNYNLLCKECRCKIKAVLPVDSVGERWICPKHGNVTVAIVEK